MSDMTSRIMSFAFPILLLIFMTLIIYVIATNADKFIKGCIKMMGIILGV